MSEEGSPDLPGSLQPIWMVSGCLLMEVAFSCATGSRGVASALGLCAGHLGWELSLCVPCMQLSYGSLPFLGLLRMGGALLGASHCLCCFLSAELVSVDFESGSQGGTALLLSGALPPPYLISSLLRPTRLPFPWLPPGSQSPLCAKWARQVLRRSLPPLDQGLGVQAP